MNERDKAKIIERYNKIALTVDADMVHYDTGRHFDEMESTFGAVRRCLEEFPDIKTTWFIRIDEQMERLYGSPACVFEKHASKIEWLRSNGHEIGWHHHAYAYNDSQWNQEVDESVICDHLKRYGEIALKMGLKTARMGWGFHTNRTMKVLDEMGFCIDSTAIPRPQYQWNPRVCDWSISPQRPYQPSVRDYRVAGSPHLAIWEVPMTTTVVPMPADTESDVIRYIELAYDSAMFEKAIASVSDMEQIVLIFHPYKILTSRGKKALSSCDTVNMRNNLKTLAGCGKRFTVISETIGKMENAKPAPNVP